MMYEVVLTFESAVALLLSVTIQMNASKQCFAKILFITLYKGVLPFEPVDKIPYDDHSNKSCLTLLSVVTVYLSLLMGSCFIEISRPHL